MYQNTGHVEIPDLARNVHANVIHFAPPAIHTQQDQSNWAESAGQLQYRSLELKQQAGTATVTARLTFAHEGVLRYGDSETG